MGGRGTYAIGNNVPYTYETVAKIEGVKVLEGIGSKHSLPEEAHLSQAYIKLYPDGKFKEMRCYDKDHYLILEIAYHPEPKISSNRQPVFHYHLYNRKFERTHAIKMTKAMYKHFKKFFVGISKKGISPTYKQKGEKNK